MKFSRELTPEETVFVDLFKNEFRINEPNVVWVRYDTEDMLRAIPTDFSSILRDALSLISARQSSIIRLLYGVDCEKRRAIDLAQEYDFPYYKIGEMRDSALRRLRSPEFRQYLRYGKKCDNPLDHVDRDLNEISIDYLGLELRSANALRRSDIHTVGTLVTKSVDDLMSNWSVGKMIIRNVESRLQHYGLSLKQ